QHYRLPSAGHYGGHGGLRVAETSQIPALAACQTRRRVGRRSVIRSRELRNFDRRLHTVERRMDRSDGWYSECRRNPLTSPPGLFTRRRTRFEQRTLRDRTGGTGEIRTG